MQFVIRHDDFDFRLPAEDYIAVHKQFIKAGLTETAVLQLTQWGNVHNYQPKLITYMNTSPNWEFQLHGWSHEHYDQMDYKNIVRDLAASILFCQRLFKATPTIWYPPWNCDSPAMQEAATYLDLRIDNESNDISKFLREYDLGVFTGNSFYFHAWNRDERKLIPQAIKAVLALEKETAK